jgi:hypothetical protein
MSESNDSEIRKRRKKEPNKEWKQNPKSKYLEVRESSVTEGDFNREKYRIERFEAFIQQHEDIPEEVGLRDVVLEDVYDYLYEDLAPDEELIDNTIEEHLIDLNYFYKTLRAHKVLDGNPVYRPDREEGDRGALAEVRESDEFSLSDSAKRPYIPMHRMRKFLSWLDSPRERGFHLVGLKTAARSGTVINIDLRCLHIAHPMYYQILDELGISLDERVNNKPDSIHLYKGFNRGTEIPNEDRPGPDEGEIRTAPSKRKEENGSVIPLDSELKTALLEWVMIRPPTPEKNIHSLFTKDGLHGRRLDYESFNSYWSQDKSDSVRRFGREESLESCPDCQGEVIEKNPKQIAPGRHYDCRDCGERYWRSMMWEGGLESPQKFVFHCHRNYFSDAHRVGKSEITDNVMAEVVRKHKVRGDLYKDKDADRQHYDNPENLDWEKDVREPYLDAIYKFNLYDDPVPAVGEGWGS